MLVILGEGLAQTPVDNTKHDGVRKNLRGLAGTRGQSQKNARRQQNKKKDGDDDVKIHVCILMRN